MQRFLTALTTTMAAALTVACANTGGIKPATSTASGFAGAMYQGETTVINQPSGAEQYRVFNQGSSGFISLEANREDAQARAATFCSQKDKTIRPLEETVSKPPHILGNFPRAELVFECIEKPALTATNTAGDVKLGRLVTLKKLLDDGALTKVEFDKEKRKILGEK